MTAHPAGEHHTGALDLTGEGNAPVSPISDEAVAEIAARMFDGDLVRQPQRVQDRVWRDAHAALTAAYPAIRQQVAEEIAAALERSEDDARQAETTEGIAGNKTYAATWGDLATGYMRSAELAREIGGKA